MAIVKIWCRSSRKYHEIDENEPLMKALPRHIWDGETRKGIIAVSHRTYEDELEELADREICSVCGVPHGANPYTGCEIPSQKPTEKEGGA